MYFSFYTDMKGILVEIAKTKGLIVAPFTPFAADGEQNLKLIPEYANLLVRNGMSGAFVCGTSAEGQSLGTRERLAQAEAWLQAAPKGFKIIVHAGANSLPEVKQILKHAQEKGAQAAAFVAPCFFKPADAQALAAYCADIAKAAPELPLYYYNIPALSGVNIPVLDFLAAVDGKVPNFAGVKYTYENLMDYSQCVEFAGGKYDILFGRDEILLCSLTLGAQGAVGSTFNFAAPLYLDIIKRYYDGDMTGAKGLQVRSHELLRALFTQGVHPLSAQRAVMRRLGLNLGESRLPLTPVGAEGYRKIEAALDVVRFDDYRCR